jgi:chaperonin GroEL
MAILLGAEIVETNYDPSQDSRMFEMLGTCERLTSTKSRTVMYGCNPEQRDAVNARIESLLKQLKGNEQITQFDRDKLSERVAKLSAKVARIHIQAETEVEFKERFDRAEDAVCASRAAMESGYVAGGGVALLRIANKIKTSILPENPDQGIGISMALRAMESPLRQIAKNAAQEDSVIAWRCMHAEGEGASDSDVFGYNARTNEFGDMVEMGIIDPMKVTRSALVNAASVAGLMITVEAAVGVKEDLVRY